MELPRRERDPVAFSASVAEYEQAPGFPAFDPAAERARLLARGHGVSPPSATCHERLPGNADELVSSSAALNPAAPVFTLFGRDIEVGRLDERDGRPLRWHHAADKSRDEPRGTWLGTRPAGPRLRACAARGCPSGSVWSLEVLFWLFILKTKPM